MPRATASSAPTAHRQPARSPPRRRRRPSRRSRLRRRRARRLRAAAWARPSAAARPPQQGPTERRTPPMALQLGLGTTLLMVSPPQGAARQRRQSATLGHATRSCAGFGSYGGTPVRGRGHSENAPCTTPKITMLPPPLPHRGDSPICLPTPAPPKQPCPDGCDCARAKAPAATMLPRPPRPAPGGTREAVPGQLFRPVAVAAAAAAADNGAAIRRWLSNAENVDPYREGSTASSRPSAHSSFPSTLLIASWRSCDKAQPLSAALYVKCPTPTPSECYVKGATVTAALRA